MRQTIVPEYRYIKNEITADQAQNEDFFLALLNTQGVKGLRYFKSYGGYYYSTINGVTNITNPEDNTVTIVFEEILNVNATITYHYIIHRENSNIPIPNYRMHSDYQYDSQDSTIINMPIIFEKITITLN